MLSHAVIRACARSGTEGVKGLLPLSPERLIGTSQFLSTFPLPLSSALCQHARTQRGNTTMADLPEVARQSTEDSCMNKRDATRKGLDTVSTDKRNRVDKHVCREKEMLLLEITDTGIGIPEEDQALIFDPFFRSRNVEGRRGLGLGLSIVREALSQMGGTVTVTSSLGKGTTMLVKIPVVDPM